MRKISLAFIWTAHVFLAAFAYPAGYSIGGTLTFESHGLGEPPGFAVQPRERQFELSVDDCNWTIKMVLVGNTNYNYFLSTYDGTNIVYASKLSQDSVERLTKKLQSQRGGKTNMYQNCTVESGPVPQALPAIANAFPWLAFCSGCYFKGITNGLVTDLHPPNEHATGYAARREIPSTFTLSANAPYLPTQVEFWWTNITRLSSDGSLLSAPLPAPFKGKFLAGRFKSEQFTNVNGMSFPTKFEMTEYRPLPEAKNEDDFRRTLIIQGTVTSISPSQRQWTNDVLEGEALVTDLRFSSNSPIPRYRISNGSIPSMDDTNVVLAKAQAVREMVERKRHAEAAKAPRRPPGRWLLLLVLLPVTFIPLVFLFKTKTNKSMEKHHTT